MRSLTKVLLSCLSAILIFSSTLSASSEIVVSDYEIPIDDTLPILSEAVLLYDETEDRILYRKGDENARFSPASTVKLMIGIVAMEKYKDQLDRKITVTAEMIRDKEGLSMYIEPGEVWSVYDLIAATVMYGAGDAALILAVNEGGTANEFIAELNEKAKDIGCTDTHFRNLSGLYIEGAYTTLEDQIKIASYASRIPELIEIAMLDKLTVAENETTPQRTILSRNLLVSRYGNPKYFTEGVTGLNFGSTEETGEVLIVSSEFSGKKYFIAIFGGYTLPAEGDEKADQTVFEDAVYLLDYAQTAFGYMDVLDTGRIVAELPVLFNTTEDHVTLVPSSTVSLFLPKNTDIEAEITTITILYETELHAPVVEGQVAGELKLYYRETELCRVPLITTSAIAQSKILYGLYRIENFVLSMEFLIFVSAVVLLSVIYVLVSAIVRGRKKNRRKRLR